MDRKSRLFILGWVAWAILAASVATSTEPAVAKPELPSLRKLLDAPLLFVKQQPYFAPHIYDDYIVFHPGGGIYILENPSDEPQQHRVRPLIDATTQATLGEGVYRDPELSWDAKRVVFAFKGEENGNTSIYEINIDGKGLRQLTNPGADCNCGKKDQPTKIGGGQHDVMPCYLPDGRIVFSSTRPKALVPCFNSGVNTLHIMDADGKNIRPLSVNNVNEFDPSVLPDGRILFGRWEYVDKTALYMQSLWTILPDGRMEEAYFKNNLPKPTAVLDARPVPGTHMVVASLTPHNGQAVGAIAMIDMHQGKNNLAAIFNFTPEYPTEMDQGLTRGPCDPWPISKDAVMFSNNAEGNAVIQIVDRAGRRELVHAEADISCYAPMLIKPRSVPPVVAERRDPEEPGRFLVADVYAGLTGVPRGTITQLRVLEETARTSDIPPGGRWWNQAFLVSWQGAYIVKNILGVVPVEEDGSAHFEAPSGRGLYFEALDSEGREIQRMRTFVQAVPGVTRSCTGCHENKQSTPTRAQHLPVAARREPSKLSAESWGSGFIDYPSMVQPILDQHCVECHGGAKGIGKGIDLSGGWTWAFSISYETLIKNKMVGFLNCENGSVHTSQLLPPKTIGSGASALAETLIAKHPEMARADRDLILAWMDMNSSYHGTWDYTQYAVSDSFLRAKPALAAAMDKAGCTECHAKGHIGNDWINLQNPEWSRILRAPMAKQEGSLGVGFCRNRKARTGYPMVDQGVQPPDFVIASRQPAWDDSGEPHVSVASTDDAVYRELLAVIRQTRSAALAQPRIDMPGAEPIPGRCRTMVPPMLAAAAPPLKAVMRMDGDVELTWRQQADTIGLEYRVYRGGSDGFVPSDENLIGTTTAGRFVDLLPPPGPHVYAVTVAGGEKQSKPAYAAADVPQPKPPGVPQGLRAMALPGVVDLSWEGSEGAKLAWLVDRQRDGGTLERMNKEPWMPCGFRDADTDGDTTYRYFVRAVDRRGLESPASEMIEVKTLPQIRQPVFAADFHGDKLTAQGVDQPLTGTMHAAARLSDAALDLRTGGHATFEHRADYDLTRALSVACWVRLERETQMPVVLSCGQFGDTGWFVQCFGDGWRWHVGGVSCDGGQKIMGRWVHLAAVFNGREAILYQDGKQVAKVACMPDKRPFAGPLTIGQYSTPGPSFQVDGQIGGVKIYQRVLRPEEITAEFKKGEPGLKTDH